MQVLVGHEVQPFQERGSPRGQDARSDAPPPYDAWDRSIASSATPAIIPSATPVATTPVAAATTSRLAGLGLVDREAPAVELMILQTLDGRLRLGLAAHLHEAEALAPAGGAVLDDLRTLHDSEPGEQLLQVGVTDLIGQVPDIQFPAHHHAPREG